MSKNGDESEVELLGPDKEEELTSLLTRLDEGKLTQDEQIRLGQVLPENGPQLRMMIERTMFAGPLPHPDTLNQYDPETRKHIVEMALSDQRHVQDMQRIGLQGAIDKDKRGQRYGLAIGIVGLVVAGYVAQYSSLAAGIIASIDLVGLVGIFVVPRVFERRSRPTQPDETE